MLTVQRQYKQPNICTFLMLYFVSFMSSFFHGGGGSSWITYEYYNLESFPQPYVVRNDYVAKDVTVKEQKKAAFKGHFPCCWCEKGSSMPGENAIISDGNLLFIAINNKRTIIKTKNCTDLSNDKQIHWPILQYHSRNSFLQSVRTNILTLRT